MRISETAEESPPSRSRTAFAELPFLDGCGEFALKRGAETSSDGIGHGQL